MNNEGLITIDNVTTLPGLQWVEAPMGTENILRIQLPLPDEYSNYFETFSADDKRIKLSDAGRALVEANWFSFRNMGGIADSWDEIIKDPDRIGKRIEGLDRSRGVLIESLREATVDNTDAQKLIRLMENSFRKRTEGMRITLLKAEIEAGNSPWAQIVEETANRFVNGQDSNSNLRRGAALSHIQAKRRRIEEYANEIINTDPRLSPLDHGRLRTHIENKYVDRAKVGFSQILPGKMEGLGIDGLDGIVERASLTQVGTSLDISVFYKQCVEEFIDDKKQDRLAKVEARHIEAPKRKRLSMPARIAFGATAVMVGARILAGVLGGDGDTPRTDLQDNLDARNGRPAYVSGSGATTLGLDTPSSLSANEIPWYASPNVAPIEDDNSVVLDETDTTDAPPLEAVSEAPQVDVMDDAGELSEESLNDGLFEIDGVDFSQDYQIVIPSEWSQYIGVSDQDHILSLNGDGHEKGTAMTEEDFSYQSDDTTATMAALSSAMGKNFVIQGHSYVVDSLLNNPEESDKKIVQYPFEPIRRIVEYIISTGQIPEDVLNSPITIIQGGREVRFRVVNTQKLPVENFSVMNLYSDPTYPATYQLGPDRLDLTGEGSVGTGEDVAQQGAIHLVTCTGSQEFVTGIYGEKYFTYDKQAILTLRVITEEEKIELAASADSPNELEPAEQSNNLEVQVSDEALSPTFAAEFGTDFQTQYLSELSSKRPELVRAYEPGKYSRIFLEKLFKEYSPAAAALNKFIEINHLENMPNTTWEQKLTYYLYTQKIVTGTSVDNYLKVGRSGSHGSSYGMFVPSQVIPGAQWIRYDGIMYRSNEVSPTVVVDETFQPFLYNELIGENEEALRRWGYDEHTTSDALTTSNLRAFLELIEKFYMAQNNYTDKSYEFTINGVTTNDPSAAGTELAKYLTTLLERPVTPEEILSLVNRADFNRLMDEARAKGKNLEDVVGMSRDGAISLLIEAKIPSKGVASINN